VVSLWTWLGNVMRFEGEQTLLRVYLRNTDRSGWHNTADAILNRALAQSLAGATLCPGICGLDVTGHLVEPHWWSLVRLVPVIVEIFDSPRSIGEFLPTLNEIVHEGLATLERAHVLVHRGRDNRASPMTRYLEMPFLPSPFVNLPSPEEFPIMQQSEEGQLLRIFIDNSDTWGEERLYKAIVHKAHEFGLTWAAVFRPESGFGAHHRFHSMRGEYVIDQPILVEIVDSSEKIQSLLPFLNEAVGEGLITLEGVRLLRLPTEKPV
jgi:PII-like signaling protein